MFRLIKFFISLGIFVAAIYVTFFVPLGTKTLWQHLRAIASTEQSQELVKGVKNKAAQLIQRDAAVESVKEIDEQPEKSDEKYKNIDEKPQKIDKARAEKNGDRLTAKERRRIRKLLKKKMEETEETAE